MLSSVRSSAWLDARAWASQGRHLLILCRAAGEETERPVSDPQAKLAPHIPGGSSRQPLAMKMAQDHTHTHARTQARMHACIFQELHLIKNISVYMESDSCLNSRKKVIKWLCRFLMTQPYTLKTTHRDVRKRLSLRANHEFTLTCYIWLFHIMTM